MTTCESRYMTESSRGARCDGDVGHHGLHSGVIIFPGLTRTRVVWSDDQAWRGGDASSTQVAGDHYSKFKIQIWDIWVEYGLDALTGAVVKYILRAGRKGDKVEDLKKARHTLDKLIEIEESRQGE